VPPLLVLSKIALVWQVAVHAPSSMVAVAPVIVEPPAALADDPPFR
jgi:hypothetical protein